MVGMVSILPYWRPNYPGVQFRCQLCGTKLSEDEMLTVEAKRASSGEYIFCEFCGPHLTDLTNRLGAEEARMDAEYEKTKGDRLRELSMEWLDELKRGHGVGGPSKANPAESGSVDAPPSAPPSRRPQRGTSIPNPKAA